MIDPFTAFAAAQTAVSAIKKGIQLGKDIGGISNDLARFAGAVSDLSFAHKQSENPPWYAVLFGGNGPSAMDIFAKKKQAEALRAEIKQTIVEWSLGILVVLSGIGLLGVGIYFLGKKQGKW